ncbi:MAG: hypothetical protein JXR53_00165 [Bacteroidales bacterium]|nr:hypothetical protein [Bacteroidales bacterium]
MKKLLPFLMLLSPMFAFSRAGGGASGPTNNSGNFFEVMWYTLMGIPSPFNFIIVFSIVGGIIAIIVILIIRIVKKTRNKSS